MAGRPDRQASPRDRPPRGLRLRATLSPVAVPRGRSTTAAGGDATLGEQHERVVQQVCGLAGKRVTGRRAVRTSRLGRGVVLGRHQHLGGLFGHLATGRVDATGEQRSRVGALRAVRGPRGDRRPERLEPREALRGALRGRAIEVEAAPRPAMAGRARPDPRSPVARPRRSRWRDRRAAARCRSSRPFARGGPGSASGSGRRRSRASRRAPRRPSRRASGRGRRSHPARSPARARPRRTRAAAGVDGRVAVTRPPRARAGPAARPRPSRPSRPRSSGSGGGRSRRPARHRRRHRGPRRRNRPDRRRHPTR